MDIAPSLFDLSTRYRLLREAGQFAHRRPERLAYKPRIDGHGVESDVLLGHQAFAYCGPGHLFLPVPVRQFVTAEQRHLNLMQPS